MGRETPLAGGRVLVAGASGIGEATARQLLALAAPRLSDQLMNRKHRAEPDLAVALTGGTPPPELSRS